MSVLGVLVALTVLLPRIGSWDPLKRLIMRRVNDQIPGRLAVDSISLRWTGPLVAHGAQYRDGEEFSFVADSVEVEAGLLEMFDTVRELGIVSIRRPRVRIAAPRDSPGSHAEADMMTPPAQRDSAAAQRVDTFDAANRSPAAATWDITADVRISNGEFVVALDPNVEPLALTSVNASIRVSGLAESIRIEANALEAGSGGSLDVKGSLDPGEGGVLDLQRADMEFDISCSDLSIGPALGILPADPSIPRASGVVRCEGTFSRKNGDDMAARGLLEVGDLKVFGALLGDEVPSWDRLECAFDVGRQGDMIRIGGFKLDSGDIRIDAQGVLGSAGTHRAPTGSLSGGVVIDLASLAGKVPRLLRLRDGTTVRKGFGHLAASVKSTIETQDFQVELDLRDIEALVDGREFAVERLIDLRVAGGLRQGVPIFDELVVHSPLLQGHGSGNLERFGVSLSNDLAVAMHEIKQFFELEGLDASGTLALQAEMIGLTQEKRSMTCTLTGRDIMLAGFTPDAVSGLGFEWNAATSIEVLDGGAGVAFTTPSFDFTSPLMTAAFVGRRIEVPWRDQPPTIAGGQLNVSAKLDRITDFLRGIGEISESHAAKGDLSLTCRADVNESRIELKVDDLSIEAFQVRVADAETRAQAVHLTGAFASDRQRDVLNLSTVRLEFASGELTADRVQWNDGRLSHATCRLDTQLSTLVAALGGFARLPEGSTLSGRLHGALDFATPDGQPRLDVDLAVDDFGLASLNKPPISEEAIALRFSAQLDPEKDELQVSELRLHSEMLTLTGQARVSDWANRRVLETSGLLGLDFETAAALVQHFSEVPLTGTGRKELPFKLTTELGRTSWIERLKHTSGSAAVFAKEVELYGVRAGPLQVPLVISNQLAHAALEAAIGEGTISLHPYLDVRSEPPRLVVADGSQLLSDIELTSDIAGGLLAKVHPLFVGSVVSGGRIGLKMKRFGMPIDETAMRAFELEGLFSMENIVLVPGGLLQQILGLARYDGELVTVADQLVSFERKQDRIVASPLVVRIEGHSLQFYGSVGLDGSLDYKVEIPLTPELVGERAAKELDGKSVILDIGGTAARPVLGRDAFRKAVGRLVGSVAAEKIQKEGLRLLEDLLDR